MSIWHLAILLVVVLLIFGTGKLTKIGGDLGSAIRGFKQSMDEHPAPERLRADREPAVVREAAAERGRSQRQQP